MRDLEQGVDSHDFVCTTLLIPKLDEMLCAAVPVGREFVPLKREHRALSCVRVCAKGFDDFASELNQLLAFAGATVCNGLTDAQYLICPQETKDLPSRSVS